MKKIIIVILAAASALFASCSSDSPSLSNDGNTSYKVNLENMPDYYNIYEKSSAMGKVLTHFIH